MKISVVFPSASYWLAALLISSCMQLTTAHSQDKRINLIDIEIDKYNEATKKHEPIPIITPDRSSKPIVVDHEFKTGDRFLIRVRAHRSVYLCLGNAAPDLNDPEKPGRLFTPIFPEISESGDTNAVLIKADSNQTLPAGNGLWKFATPTTDEFVKIIAIERKPNRSINAGLLSYEDGQLCSSDNDPDTSKLRAASNLDNTSKPNLLSITRPESADPRNVTVRILKFTHSPRSKQ